MPCVSGQVCRKKRRAVTKRLHTYGPLRQAWKPLKSPTNPFNRKSQLARVKLPLIKVLVPMGGARGSLRNVGYIYQECSPLGSGEGFGTP